MHVRILNVNEFHELLDVTWLNIILCIFSAWILYNTCYSLMLFNVFYFNIFYTAFWLLLLTREGLMCQCQERVQLD